LNNVCSSSTALFPKIWYQRRKSLIPRATPYWNSIMFSLYFKVDLNEFTCGLLHTTKYLLITLHIQWACHLWWTSAGNSVRIR
jgi:hypothetical protein